MSNEAWLPLARELIEQLESCELTAYPDPLSGGEPWTIGWGNTVRENGGPIWQGETITDGRLGASGASTTR